MKQELADCLARLGDAAFTALENDSLRGDFFPALSALLSYFKVSTPLSFLDNG